MTGALIDITSKLCGIYLRYLGKMTTIYPECIVYSQVSNQVFPSIITYRVLWHTWFCSTERNGYTTILLLWWRWMASHRGNDLITGIFCNHHYNDVIMGVMASQITSLTIVYSSIYSDADQRKHQSSASLAFVLGIHRGPVNSPHKWPVLLKMFPFGDVIMM